MDGQDKDVTDTTVAAAAMEEIEANTTPATCQDRGLETSESSSLPVDPLEHTASQDDSSTSPDEVNPGASSTVSQTHLPELLLPAEQTRLEEVNPNASSTVSQTHLPELPPAKQTRLEEVTIPQDRELENSGPDPDTKPPMEAVLGEASGADSGSGSSCEKPDEEPFNPQPLMDPPGEAPAAPVPVIGSPVENGASVAVPDARAGPPDASHSSAPSPDSMDGESHRGQGWGAGVDGVDVAYLHSPTPRPTSPDHSTVVPEASDGYLSTEADPFEDNVSGGKTPVPAEKVVPEHTTAPHDPHDPAEFCAAALQASPSPQEQPWCGCFSDCPLDSCLLDVRHDENQLSQDIDLSLLQDGNSSVSSEVNDGAASNIMDTSVSSLDPFDEVKEAPSSIAEPDTTYQEYPDTVEAKAREILSIIRSYSPNWSRIQQHDNNNNNNNNNYPAQETFLRQIRPRVATQQPIQMIIPAFPMKSPNRTSKVLGCLPDLGEELALRHLSGLCANIADVYPAGAWVRVQSDGIVYNDLLGVPDEDVFDYGEELRRMARDLVIPNLRFTRVRDLLKVAESEPASGEDSDPKYEERHDDDVDVDDEPLDVRRQNYLRDVPALRSELMQRYAEPDLDIDAAIQHQVDTCLTYRGYRKFLSCDLVDDERVIDAGQTSKKAVDRVIGRVAREMLVRGKAFAAAILDRFPDCVRLSIHEGTGQNKISVSLLPPSFPAQNPNEDAAAPDAEEETNNNEKTKKKSKWGPTPWHSVVAVELDGSYRAVAVGEVRDSYDLVHLHGRPYFYLARSEHFRWSFPITVSPQYPCGLVITPAAVPTSIAQVPMSQVRALAPAFSPIVLRDFEDSLKEDVFVARAEALGTLCPWNFGIIQKVRDIPGQRTTHTSNVTTNEAMPFHYDGVFKFQDREQPDGSVLKVSCPPLLQFFACHANTVPVGQGYTLFAPSRLILPHLVDKYTLDRLGNVTWTLESKGFWSAQMPNLPLVVTHPVDGQPCLRWHQPWDATRSQIATSTVEIENDEQVVSDDLERIMYDRRACMYFAWQKGDLLVNDNFALHHTRTTYETGWERELWRIHVD